MCMNVSGTVPIVSKAVLLPMLAYSYISEVQYIVIRISVELRIVAHY